MHRTIRDRAKLLQKKNKKKREEEKTADLLGIAGPGTSATPRVGQLLQPRRMRALEKDLTEKVSKGSQSFDFSAYYNGNLLHVAVNSDSDSDESSVDSLDDF